MKDSFHQDVHSLLFGFPATEHNPANQCQRALKIARLLQTRATSLQTTQERLQQHELDRLIQNPSDKATLTSITDQAFRSTSPRRSMDQLIHILDVQGIPRFFSRIDRTLPTGATVVRRVSSWRRNTSCSRKNASRNSQRDPSGR